MNGVTRFFIPAIDSNHTQSMYELEKNYPENIFLMMGLHPTLCKENYLEELQHVEEELASKESFTP
jgi:TatD DNase family protein